MHLFPDQACAAQPVGVSPVQQRGQKAVGMLPCLHDQVHCNIADGLLSVLLLDVLVESTFVRPQGAGCQRV